MGEVAVHLHHVAGAVRRARGGSRRGRPGRSRSSRCGAAPAPSRARAASSSASSPVPSGEPSSTTSTRKPSGAAAREDLAGRRERSPRCSRPRCRWAVSARARRASDRRTLERAADPRCGSRESTAPRPTLGAVTHPELSNGAIADALEELGDLYELDGAIVHRVLAYRTAAKAVREAPVSVAALARAGARDRAAGHRQHAAGEDPRARRDRHDSRGREAAGEVPAGPDRDSRACPGSGPSARGCCTTSSASTRWRRCARRRWRSGCATCGDSARSSRRACWRRWPDRRELNDGRARAAAAAAGARDRRGARRGPGAIGGGTDVQLAGSCAAPGRQRQGPRPGRRRAPTRRRWPRSSASSSRSRASSSAGDGGRAGAHPLRHRRRPADRRARPARQPAAALHRLGRPQRGAARRRRCAAACTSPSTACSTTRAAQALTCASEQEVYALLGLAYIEPELRENRGELEAARLSGAGSQLPELIELGGHPRRPAQPHRRLRRARHDRGDGASPRGSAATSTWRSPTTRPATASATTSPPSSCAARSSWSARPTSASRGSSCWRAARSTSCPTARWTTRTSCSRELDWVIASVHTSFGMGEQAMTERMITADRASAGGRDRAPHRAPDRAPRAPTRSTCEAVFAAAARTRHDARDQRQPRPPRPLRGQRPRRRGRAGVTIVIDSDAHRTGDAGEHALGRRHRPPRLADRRATSPTPARWRELRELAQAGAGSSSLGARAARTDLPGANGSSAARAPLARSRAAGSSQRASRSAAARSSPDQARRRASRAIGSAT